MAKKDGKSDAKLTIKRQSKIRAAVDEWLKFTNELSEPSNDLERTRIHYLCIHRFEDKSRMVFNNLVAIPALLISIVGSTIASLKNGKEKNTADALAMNIETSKVRTLDELGIPESIIAKYPKIVKINDRRRVRLLSRGVDANTLKFFKSAIKKYPFHPYMLLLIWIHLLKFNKMIKDYRPKAIISTESENDFTASYMTYFCESKKVENICVMHGEYLLTPLHAFVRFSKFYVWDSFYIKQFEKVRCPKEQFEVFYPNRFKMEINKTEEYYLTYYLQAEDEFALMRLRETLRIFYHKGYKCKLRPHPRVTDLGRLKSIFKNENIEIEDVRIVPLEQSLGKSKYVISKFSTVLSEAIENDIQAVIDDYSDPGLYRYLEKTMYINLSRTELRLSDMIKQIQDEKS